MRLIRTDVYPLVLEEFFDEGIPPYAILSHTWGEDEVSLLDMKHGEATTLAGYAKIKYASDQAAEDGYSYVWVDTCCIDKTSSAELSEAINSMYRWYQKAGLCYVFLIDVHTKDIASVEAFSRPRSALAKSRWFTRGWTLQELIAPSKLVFFNSSWDAFGTKNSLSHVLSSITGVDATVLNGSQVLSDVSVAKRMSWASQRRTTRQEDIAYSLIGLFGVNMPLLYEGKKAFTRLLEEIIKDSDDQSIFAWRTRRYEDKAKQTGLLAESPADFVDSGQIFYFRDWSDNRSYFMTNKGLRIHLDIEKSDTNIHRAALKCVTTPYGQSRVCIWLRRLEGEQWVRVRPDIHDIVSIDPGSRFHDFKAETIFVRKNPVSVGNNDIISTGVIYEVRPLESTLIPFKPERINVYPQERWNRREIIVSTGIGAKYELVASQDAVGQAGILRYSPDGQTAHTGFCVMMGWTAPNKPWCLLRNISESNEPSMADLYLSSNTESDGWSQGIRWRGEPLTAHIATVNYAFSSPERNRRHIRADDTLPPEDSAHCVRRITIVLSRFPPPTSTKPSSTGWSHNLKKWSS